MVEFRKRWTELKDGWEQSGEIARRNIAEFEAQKAASGRVDVLTTMTLFKDGTFTITSGLRKPTDRERLIGFDHDADSMRRKSATGRGAAMVATGGLSLLASNNRGVMYVTVTGETSGVKTYTTQNPDSGLLTEVRSLKAAADVVLAQGNETGAAPLDGVAAQLQQLADLHAAGALTDEEFATAKARLLD